MRFRIFSFLVTFCFLLFTLAQVGMAEEPPQQNSTSLPSINIGIVTDGPLTLKPDMVAVFKREILQMAEGEFVINFPGDMVLQADSTVDGINRHLDTLLSNPETDLVIALGLIASTESVKRTDLKKPLIAPLVFDVELQEAPKDGAGSGVNNLFYLNIGTSIDKELITFRKLVPFERLALLFDERDINNLPVLTKISRSLAFEHSIDVQLIPVSDKPAAAVEQIPDDTKAVMVGPLWQSTPDELKVLSEKLIDKKIAAFSLANFEYIEMGFLQRQCPKGRWGR